MVLFAAILLEICLGSVYGWSVFIKPTAELGIKWADYSLPVALGFLGIGAVIGGAWNDRKGPRVVTTFAGILYGSGFLVAAWAVAHVDSYIRLVGFGPMCGLAMGIGYVCPIATVTKWYPDKRGLMSGLVVMGFGLGSQMSLLARPMIPAYGVPTTLVIFGVAYTIIILFCSTLMVVPPEGWKPAGWVPSGSVAKHAAKRSFDVRGAASTPGFWLLWAMLFLNTCAGLPLINSASPTFQAKGLTATEAGYMVALIGVFNAGGRTLCSWGSQLIGRAQVLMIIFGVQVCLFFIVPHVESVTAFALIVIVIATCYGGGFGVIPPFTADLFGPKNQAAIYGWILAGWGSAAVASKFLSLPYQQVGFVMLFAMILPFLAIKEVNRMAALSDRKAA